MSTAQPSLGNVTLNQWARIAAIVREVIAPGGRAILPPHLCHAVEDFLQNQTITVDGRPQRLGRYWDPLNSGLSETEIETRVDALYELWDRVHRSFWDRHDKAIPYDADASLIYAIYYLPTNFHKSQVLLLDLLERGRLARCLRVLDIGTGVGTVPFAISDFLQLVQHAAELVDVTLPPLTATFTCIDASRTNLQVFEGIRQHGLDRVLPSTSVLLVHQEVNEGEDYLSAVDDGTGFDLIVFSNVLAEFQTEQWPTLVGTALPHLHSDGYAMVIETAQKENARGIHRLAQELARSGVLIAAPWARLWSNWDGSEDLEPFWGFRGEKLRVPSFLRPIEDRRRRLAPPPVGPDGFEDDRLRWSYLILSSTINDASLGRDNGTRPHAKADRETKSEAATDIAADHIRADTDAKQPLASGPFSIISPYYASSRSYLAVTDDNQVCVLAWQRHVPVPPLDFDETIEIRNASRQVNPTFRSGKGPFHQVQFQIVLDSRSTIGRPEKQSDFLPEVRIFDGTSKREALEFFLWRLFGFEHFRDNERGDSGQVNVISRTLAGDDALAIIATSGGKSLCFQYPAMLLPGTCIVVAPLLSLIRDQVHNLRERFGFDNVASLSSDLTPEQREQTLLNLVAGRYKIVYTTPEQFRDDRFVRLLKGLARSKGINLFAIDEVHCLSQWGHDFRPAYLLLRRRFREIAAAVSENHHIPILGLTATASDYVVQDVVNAIEFDESAIYRYSFDRPELSFAVIEASNSTERKRDLLDQLQGKLRHVLGEHDKPGIIFVPYTGVDKKPFYSDWLLSAKGLATELKRRGYKTDPFYSDLPVSERARVQDGFVRGEYDFIVATKGFGMGIDKADVRFVIHYGLAASLEDYYQQAGRAGRDGNHAHCVMLFEIPDSDGEAKDQYYRTDFDRMKFFVDSDYPEQRGDIWQLWEHLAQRAPSWSHGEARILFEDADTLLTELGWITTDAVKLARDLVATEQVDKRWLRLSQSIQSQGPAPQKLTEARDLLDALAKCRTIYPTVQECKQSWDRIVPDALFENLAKSHEWPPKVQRAAADLLEKTGKLPNRTNGERAIAAMFDILIVDRDIRKLRSRATKRLDLALEALRRMGFLDHSAVDAVAQFFMRQSWKDIAASVADGSVSEFALRLAVLQPDHAQGRVELDVRVLSPALKMSTEMIDSSLDYLELCKFIGKVNRNTKIRMLRLRDDYASQYDSPRNRERYDRELEQLYERKQAQLRMLEEMQHFVDTGSCRRQLLIGYFNGRNPTSRSIVRCNFCDNCCPQGFGGDRAQPVYASQRQVSVIERLESFLARDLLSSLGEARRSIAGAVRLTMDDIAEAMGLIQDAQPQGGEEDNRDYLRALVIDHLDSRIPGSRRARYLRAHLQRATGDAANYLSEVADVARKCQSDRCLTEAEELFQECVLTAPSNVDYLSGLFDAQKALERDAEVMLDTMRRLIRVRDGDPTRTEEWAELEGSCGDRDTAIDGYLRACHLYADQSDSSESITSAANCWLHAVSLSPDAERRVARCRPQTLPASVWLRAVDILASQVQSGRVDQAAVVARDFRDDLASPEVFSAYLGSHADERVRPLADLLCQSGDDQGVRVLWEWLGIQSLRATTWRSVAELVRSRLGWEPARHLLHHGIVTDRTDAETRLGMCQYWQEIDEISLRSRKDILDKWARLLEEGKGDGHNCFQFSRLLNRFGDQARARCFAVVGCERLARSSRDGILDAAEPLFQSFSLSPADEDVQRIWRLFTSLVRDLGSLGPIHLERAYRVFPVEWYRQLPPNNQFLLFAGLHEVVKMDNGHRGQFPHALATLGILSTDLLRLPEVRDTTHAQWMAICKRLAATDRLGTYIQRCFALSPPEVEKAEETFSLLLSAGDGSAIRICLRALDTHCPSARIRQAVSLFSYSERVQAVRPSAWSGTSQEDFSALRGAFPFEADPAAAHVLALIIRAKCSRIRERYLTPVELQIRAWAFAREFTRARGLAQEYPDLTVGPQRIPALRFIEGVEGSWGENPSPCDYSILDKDFRRILNKCYGFDLSSPTTGDEREHNSSPRGRPSGPTEDLSWIRERLGGRSGYIIRGR